MKTYLITFIIFFSTTSKLMSQDSFSENIGKHKNDIILEHDNWDIKTKPHFIEVKLDGVKQFFLLDSNNTCYRFAFQSRKEHTEMDRLFLVKRWGYTKLETEDSKTISWYKKGDIFISIAIDKYDNNMMLNTVF